MQNGLLYEIVIGFVQDDAVYSSQTYKVAAPDKKSAGQLALEKAKEMYSMLTKNGVTLVISSFSEIPEHIIIP